MVRRLALICCLPAMMAAMIAAPLSARESLGVFSNWGAFRDDSPARCYAIAAPRGRAETQAFASIANWPRRSIRGQLHIRLSRSVADGAQVTLLIGERSFDLAANGRNAWAQGARMDAAIVAAMRSASTMRVRGRDERGRAFTDRYDLAGAATAIDAATVGCARAE